MTTIELPAKLKQLDVLVGQDTAGSLAKDSIYHFSYAEDALNKPAVGLFMPRTTLAYQDAALFPVMDQNLPEGYLFQRIREMFPKQALTPMHLLALAGTNGIGRLGFLQKGQLPTKMQIVSREQLLRAHPNEDLFDELVRAYLGTGTGIAGMQPKIMVPDRATVPVPNLIVKTGSPAYPGLAANEFLCMTAAKRAGIKVPDFDLSDDGTMMILDRFDLRADGSRLGFEDVAALMGLQVHDKLSDRKYFGSYEVIAQVFRTINLPAADLEEFFAQVAFSAMVRNGDGHLKNFGVLYTSGADVRLSPMFDVITTSIYQYERYPGGPSMEDNTMALKLFRGKRSKSKTYPLTNEMIQFGTQVCGVTRPLQVLERIAQALLETLREHKTDTRIPAGLISKMGSAWERGMPTRERGAILVTPAQEDTAREVQVRLNALPVLSRMAGASYTFWQHASTAMQLAQDAALAVDWKAVEDTTITESMGSKGQSAKSVFDALCIHSPGSVTPAQQADLAHRCDVLGKRLLLNPVAPQDQKINHGPDGPLSR